MSTTVFLAMASQWASAQQPAPRVYTYAEQMPQLPGRGGQQQLVMTIMKQLRLTGKVEPSCYRAMIYFEVSPNGRVQRARITGASQSAAVDSALLHAVRSLPTLRPGYQQGKPVTVGIIIPLRLATQ